MGNSSSRFDESKVPSMEKKVVVITGANSGIGFETTKIFAKKGADVVMLGRSRARLEEAAKEVRAAAAEGIKSSGDESKSKKEASKVEIEVCDLSRQKSVREVAAKLLASHADGIDLLVNNAGVMALPERVESEDGFEMQMATNHFGHFTLTSLLLPLLAKRPGSRVVNVSSGAHKMGPKKGIDLDDINAEKEYAQWYQYAYSKFANVLFTKELQRRLEAAGLSGGRGITTQSCHPGYCATNLQKHMTMGGFFNAVLAQSQYMGSLSSMMAATADLPPASYVGPPGRVLRTGYPVVCESDPRSDDKDVAKRLWDISVEATKTSWDMLEKAKGEKGATPAAAALAGEVGAAAGGGGGGDAPPAAAAAAGGGRQ